MEDYGIYMVIGVIAAITLALLHFLQTKKYTEATSPVVQSDEAVIEPQNIRHIAAARPVIGGARNRAAANARHRRAAQTQREEPESASNAESEEVSDEDAPAVPTGKVGKKKLARIQAKAEKKAKRLEEERLRQEKKEDDERKYELRKEEEEKREQEEKEKEAEERLRREEEERKEQEEYEKMKLQFQVDEEGFEDMKNEQDEENLLQEFIDYIEKSKVVVLEELAALFKLRTQAAIDRIMDLQLSGRLIGVIDDRGKFISISHEELQNVAKFINRRGRVSLVELAAESNKFINLNPEVVPLKS